MDDAGLRAAFDEQVRRRTRDDGPGPCAEADGAVVRQVAPGGHGWSGITWSDLAGPAGADAAIAAQVRYFGALGQPFEWKLYDYDQPSDLGARLTAAGFLPDEDEPWTAASRTVRRPDACPDRGGLMATSGVAVVTGAGSGLGRSITRALLTTGWQVAAAGRRWAALQETVATAPAAEAALPVLTDVTLPDSVAALFAATVNRWGRVDLLVEQRGHLRPGRRGGRDLGGRLAAGGGHQPHRCLPVYPAGGPVDEGARTRAAAGSSTTARSRPTCPGRAASPTPRPSTR